MVVVSNPELIALEYKINDSESHINMASPWSTRISFLEFSLTGLTVELNLVGP